MCVQEGKIDFVPHAISVIWLTRMVHRYYIYIYCNILTTTTGLMYLINDSPVRYTHENVHTCAGILFLMMIVIFVGVLRTSFFFFSFFIHTYMRDGVKYRCGSVVPGRT